MCSLTIVVALVGEAFAKLDLAVVMREAAACGAGVLLLVAASAIMSWAAVACYDAAALPSIGMRLPLRRSLAVGLTASGLGQTLGFGILVAGFTRWRMLRREGLTPAGAARASGAVAVGFFGGLAVVGLAAAALSPEAAALLDGFAPQAPATAIAIGAVAALLVLARASRRAGSLRQALLFVGLAAIDVTPAAFALWLLLPDGPSFAAVFAAYVGALSAGLLAGTPGGAGAFEGVILLALPDVAPESALAAIFVFRAFFHLAPATIGLTLLAAEELRFRRARAAPPAARIEAAIAGSGRAEAALLHLGDAKPLFIRDADAFLLCGARRRGLVALGDPVGSRAHWPELLAGFRRAARRRGRAAMIYRAGPRAAALGRAAGFAPVRIGMEAMIDPAAFDLGASSRRRLRRKISQAEKSGLQILRHAPGAAPLHRLKPVSDAWLESKGGRERGFSVGRFDAAWLRRFPVLEARDGGGAAVAFLSLWVSGDGAEWSIDLMRAVEDAPSGAIAALIVAAIGDAKASGARRFSLCMAPLAGLDAAKGPVAALLRRIWGGEARGRALRGLHEFKASFAPRWRPCYALMPKGPGAATALLALHGLLATTRAVTAPPAPEPEEMDRAPEALPRAA